VSGVRFPDGFHLEQLRREHPRKQFRCGAAPVEDWLATKALQNQEKHLSGTKVLLNTEDSIAGYYTLATGQVRFDELPPDAAKGLPRRLVPVAVLAWLGVSVTYQGQGLGRQLLAQALKDCYLAGKTFAFVAVILDCINDAARAFYQHWDFVQLPGHSYRLFLSTQRLEALMQAEGDT
jgi:GNAT superfamily N-acetyltransferase